MTTPFDEVIGAIRRRGYHNHRLDDHSDIMSEGIYRDLLDTCGAIREDARCRTIAHWLNVPAPGARKRKIDLFVGEQDEDGLDISKLRICVENKSVMTAHRNRDARFDDLNETMKVVHAAKSEAVIVGTVLVGVADKVLNVPDKLKPRYRGTNEFDLEILHRLSSGDQALWRDYHWAVSTNRRSDPAQTIAKLRQLRTRPPGHTHVEGYDYLLFVPVYVDNVNAPYVARDNTLNIDVDADYNRMLDTVCKAYSARWHL